MSTFSLLQTPRFRPLFWTQFWGAFNDNFFKNALIILVTYQSLNVAGLDPAQMVPLAGGIFILPFFLFSATAGLLADRFEKTRIIRAVKIAEVLIMVLACYGFLAAQYELLLVVLFLMGAHSTFFGPVKYSILPVHLEETELVTGNALIEAGTFIAILLGTILGGLLITLPAGPILLSFGLLLFAILGLISGFRVPLAPPVAPDLKIPLNFLKPTIQIITSTRKNRSVFLSLLGISWFWFFGAMLLSLFPTWAKDQLRVSEHVVTWFLTLFSIGIAAGSILCERFSRRTLELGLVPIGSFGMSLFAVLLAKTADTPFEPGTSWLSFVTSSSGLLTSLYLLVLSLFGGFFIVPLYTLMQERAAPSERSRVVAANNILNAVFMVLAAGALMLFQGMGLSYSQIFWVLAILNFGVTLYLYFLLPEFLFRFCLYATAHILYRMKVSGSENIPRKGPAILVANHVSFIDWMIVAAASPRPPRFIMDFAYIRGPVLRFFLKQSKVIPIATQEEDPAIKARAYELAIQELRDGELLCIFPEGAITRDGDVGAFKPGILKIIGDAPVPIVPIALCGLWGSIFSRKDGPALKKPPKRFWSRIAVRVGRPIGVSQVSLERMREEILKLKGSEN